MEQTSIFGKVERKKINRGTVKREKSSCIRCPIHKKKIKPYGSGEVKILWITETPPDIEMKEYLQDVAKQSDIDISKCRVIGAIGCRTNEEIKDEHISCCRASILTQIRKLKPHLIIPMGYTAIKALLQEKMAGDIRSTTVMRGWKIPDHEWQAWICPTYGLEMLLEEKCNPTAKLLFEQDVGRALFHGDNKIPTEIDWEEKVNILNTKKEIISYIEYLLFDLKPEWTAFDYEGPSLKPHREEYDVTSIAISHEKESAYAFMVNGNPAIKKWVRRYLKSDSKKIASYINFEEMWSRVCFNTPVNNWGLDTLLASHWLDNRTGASSIKFQAAVRWGLYDYDSHINPFLKSGVKNNANAPNKIHKIPKRKLLIYNGIDAVLEYRAGMEQLEEIVERAKSMKLDLAFNTWRR